MGGVKYSSMLTPFVFLHKSTYDADIIVRICSKKQKKCRNVKFFQKTLVKLTN